MNSTPSLYINGQWIEGESTTFHAHDPGTGQAYWTGAAASLKQVAMAVDSARNANPAWQSLALDERIGFIEAFALQIKNNKNRLAEIISQETGKPYWETLTEVAAMAGKVAISIKAYHQRTGLTEQDIPGGVAATRHKAHGVLAVFGPYNFPGHLPNGHIVPALLAGNCVVFKPSELTPLTAEFTVQLWQKAGLPDGVLNLLQGEKQTGIDLAEQHDIDGLLFTGSMRTGVLLHNSFANSPHKILALELGGNNPLIIQPVADCDAAVYHTLQSAFISAGQRCTCARRLYVPSGDWGEQFLKRLKEATQKLSVGYWSDDPAPFMGPVISSTVAQQLLTHQKQMVDNGGRPVVEMKHIKSNTGFLTPGIVDMTESTNLDDSEIFGPLLQTFRFDNFDDAIAAANKTRYGLAAGLFSDDREDYNHFYQRIRAGIVNWNKQLTGASSAAPFGGVGLSGNHRPSAFYAADYCAYPVASMESETLTMPDNITPGVSL